DIIWDQRRAVQAYWIGAGGTPVSMRLRFLHDGREFASCYVFNKQVGSKVLSALHLLLDRGDFHPMWGAPEANVFQAEDFRVRYEFIGPGLNMERLKDGRYVVASGKCQAVITPAPCLFGGVPVQWRSGQKKDCVEIDAVLYHGKRKAFDFKTLSPVHIAAGVEIISATSALPKTAAMKWSKGATIQWGGKAGLNITVPERAIPLVE
ncbi:MAG: hypothetical protein WCD79_08605, partial [Chthoniobacteraceae bacterium]